MNTTISQKKFKLLSAVLFVAAALALATNAPAAPGDLDTTFGGTGKIRAGAGAGDDSGNAVARQSDGKLIVAGTSENTGFGTNMSLVRYNQNGTLDTAFGTFGKVLLPSVNGAANALAIQPDGKIVLAGFTILSSSPNPIPGNPPIIDSAFLVARFNANGTPDATFDGNGIVFTNFGSGEDYANAVAVQTDGKIVAAGYASGGAALVRYNANGTLDTAFDGDGRATPSGIREIHSLGIQSGKIFAAGSNGNNATLARLNANGSLDTAFDVDGVAILDADNNTAAFSLAFLSTDPDDNRVVVTGTDNNYCTLPCIPAPSEVMLWSRDAATGAPDASIGANGKRTVSVAGGSVGTSIRIRLSNFGAADRILIAGDFGVVRLFLSGAVDTAFGSGGGFNPNFGSDKAMLIQPSGNQVVLAGTVGKTGAPQYADGDFKIVRLTAAGAFDTTFSGDGKRADDVGSKTPDLPYSLPAARAVAVQTDGKIVVAGNSSIFRFNADGTFDSTFDEDGKAKIPGGEIRGLAIQPDGKIVVAGDYFRFSFTQATNIIFAFRLNADGTLDNSFDADGGNSTSIGAGYAIASAVGVQSGGIIVGGYATTSGTSNADFAAVRFTPNGALDTNFGTSGKVLAPIGTGDDLGNALKVQTDNKFIIAGSAANGSNTDFALARFNPDGSPDTSFSFDGKLTLAVGAGNDAANALAIHSNKIVVAGYATVGANSDFAVARFNHDGSVDTTFDADGKLTIAVGAGNDRGNSLAIEPDEQILVAGSSESAVADDDFAVVRLNPDGSLDNSFWKSADSYGSGGKVVIDLNNNGDDEANAIALDSTGRAVVAGRSNDLFGIVRLLGDVPSAALVSVGGRVTTASGKGIRNARVTLSDQSGAARTVLTGAFGAYRFTDVPAGGTYILTVSGKRFVFANPTQIVSVFEQLDDLNFVGSEQW